MLYRPPKDRKLFPKLAEADIRNLLRPGTDIVTFDDGQIVQAEGDKSWGMFVVLEGALKVSRRVANSEELMAFHTVGEFSGDLGILPNSLAHCIHSPAAYRIVSVGSPGRSTVDRRVLSLSEMLLRVLAYRARQTDSHIVQEEKLAALGKMAAGLARPI